MKRCRILFRCSSARRMQEGEWEVHDRAWLKRHNEKVRIGNHIPTPHPIRSRIKLSCHLVIATAHHADTHTHTMVPPFANKHSELSNKAAVVIIGGGEIQIYLFQNEACGSTEGQLSSICHRWSHACLTQGFIRLVVFDSRIFPAYSHQESHWIFGGRLKKKTLRDKG